MSSSNETMVLLKSSQGKIFLVNYGVTIVVADTIRNVIADTCLDDGIRLPNARGEILERVIHYCRKYHEQQIWPAEYVKDNYPLLLDICGLVRQKMNLLFLKQRMNTKPTHGPIHFRAPAKILWRIIVWFHRSKTKCWVAAVALYKVYEGIPPPYDIGFELFGGVMPIPSRNLHEKRGKQDSSYYNDAK